MPSIDEDLKDYPPSAAQEFQLLSNAIQSFGISVGDAARGLLQLRAPYDFPSNIVTAPDGIPISDTEYADYPLGNCYHMG